MADICRALVLSGGGSNGAWEAGVLWGLANYGAEEDYMWDVVTGVSIGSINGSGLSLFAPGEEKEATDFIYKTWQTIQTNDIWQQWPTGPVEGLYRPSIFDSSPGFETLKRIFEGFDGYKRHLSLTAVDIETGHVVNMTDENTPFEELHKAVIASASVPGIFSPTEIDGRILVDGMTAYNVNAQEAIDRCRGLVDDDRNIIVDVLVCDKQEYEASGLQKWFNVQNSWKNFMRAREIKKTNHAENALSGVMRANPAVNWRHAIYQSARSTGLNELSFANEVTDPLQETGKADAMAAVEALRVARELDTVTLIEPAMDEVEEDELSS